eukprot:jgi/Psemu1/207218/e_gw1.430.41.1
MANLLINHFVENINVDREPIFTFGIPHIDGYFSVFAPNASPWKQVLLLTLIETIIQMFFACFIYELIVKRRGTSISFMIGWGFVIPFSVYLPFYLLDVCRIRNRVLCMNPSVVMSIVSFRCIEAMYGTSPDVVELSIWNYCSYYANIVPYVWNTKEGKIQKITKTKLVRSFVERLLYFFALSLILSVLKHFDYKPFEDGVEFTRFSVSRDFLSRGHLLNSYFLLYFTLNTLFELTAFAENLKGLATETIFDSPLTKSKTPTDFWTKRWNHMTHLLLKRGIFEPANQSFMSGKTAMFVTFIISGLYHEYCWACIFYNQPFLYGADGLCLKGENCYEFKFGRVTAFFAYTGVIMLLERPLGKHIFFKWLSSVLPTFVIAQLLVLIHVPFVKWYGGDWIEGTILVYCSIGLFLSTGM